MVGISVTGGMAGLLSRGPDPYDFASQALVGSPARIAAWDAVLERVLGETRRLDALRYQRLAGATIVDDPHPSGSAEKRTYLMPVPRASCPEGGAFAYVWPDIFETAKANLRALAQNPPPRYAPPARVMTWSLAINWNVALLVDATNVRPMFLFPDEYSAHHAVRVWNGTGGEGGWVSGADHLLEWFSDTPGVWDFRARGPAAANSAPAGQRPQTPVEYPARDLDPQWGQYVTFDAYGYRVVSSSKRAPLRTKDLAQANVQTLWHHYGAVLDDTLEVWTERAIATYWAGLRSSEYVDAYGRALTFDAGTWIKRMGALAQRGADTSLAKTIVDAAGFYALNHLTWWQNRGITALNSETVQRLQQRARTMRIAAAPSTLIVGTVSGLLGLINPVMGAIAGALGQVGNQLMELFLSGAFTQDAPRMFFVRMPIDPTCLPESVEDQVGQIQRDMPRTDPSAAPITRFSIPPKAPDSSMVPLVAGGAVAIGLVVLVVALARR